MIKWIVFVTFQKWIAYANAFIQMNFFKLMWYPNIEFIHVFKCHSNLILTRSKFLPRLVSRIVMICINCLYFVAIDLHWFFRTRCTLNVEIMRANHFWHMRSNKASLLYISQIFLCACFPSPKKQQQNMSKIVFFPLLNERAIKYT